MCNLSRRQFLAGGTVLTLAAEAEILGGLVPAGAAQSAAADLIAPDVYFHEGNVADSADAVCNNGWIMFEDYVLVIDANYPAGARLFAVQREASAGPLPLVAVKWRSMIATNSASD
jgi:hypothetical protein